MFGKHAHDGDLAPGIYERTPEGYLVPSRKVFTSDPPRPLHVSEAGKITDITRQAIDFARDEVEKHYAERARRRGAGSMVRIDAIREMVDRAAESIMRGA